MRNKTKNRHGAFGLQVLVAVLMLLVAGVTPAWAYPARRVYPPRQKGLN